MNYITPRNKNGKAHGYWDLYYSDGSTTHKHFYYNGKQVGYEEWYGYNKLLYKKYYI